MKRRYRDACDSWENRPRADGTRVPRAGGLVGVPRRLPPAVLSSQGRRHPGEGTMNIRRIRNVMTRDVVTVTDTTPFAELVRKMAEHGVSALPVLDQDERLVGIVSEADLLRKEEYQDERNGRYLLEGRGRRAARAKAAGRTAAEKIGRASCRE